MADLKSKEKKRKQIITATPVATQYKNGKIQVDYYTETGREVPVECVGKKVVDTSCLVSKEK